MQGLAKGPGPRSQATLYTTYTKAGPRSVHCLRTHGSGQTTGPQKGEETRNRDRSGTQTCTARGFSHSSTRLPLRWSPRRAPGRGRARARRSAFRQTPEGGVRPLLGPLLEPGAAQVPRRKKLPGRNAGRGQRGKSRLSLSGYPSCRLSPRETGSENSEAPSVRLSVPPRQP